MSMPERDTMRLRNKWVVGALFFVLMGASSFWAAQSPANQPQQSQPQQNQPQRIQATPLPSDIDPSDPALPVWVKGSAPAAGANTTTKPATPGNTPANQPQQPPAQNTIGSVTKDASGGFRYVSQVNEVTLSAVVLDSKRHLVTK